MKSQVLPLVALLAFVSLARAEPTTAPAVLFPKGTLTLQAYGSYLDGNFVFSDDQSFGSATVGAGYYLWDNVSLNLEATAYRVGQAGDDATGAGVQILLRNHLFTFDRFTFFWDVGGGVFKADSHVPPGGTSFDFTFRTGPGLTYQLNDHFALIGGPRYFHLSNARIEGSRRNPSLNGFETYLGVLYKF